MSFLSGALGGFASQEDKEKKGGKSGLLQKLKKKSKVGQLPTSGRSAPGDLDAPVPEFKKGGRVKKTGLAKVHKGERVLTKKQAKKFKKRKSKER